MKNLFRNMIKITIALVFSMTIALSASVGFAHEKEGMNPCSMKHNPCDMKKMNPCAKKMNPCDMKKMNPCDMKKMHDKKMNPCSKKKMNPCSMKHNPCDK